MTEATSGVTTGRGLAAVLAQRLAAIPTWTNAVSTHRDEYRLILNLALAATRRRQVAEAVNLGIAEWDELEAAIEAEDAALDVLEAHLCGGEGAS